MGRRKRRVIRIVKKKLPTVFVCPRCGEEAVRVTIAKDTGHATVLCALCNLKDEFPAHPAAQPIDVYSYFTDRFYGVKDPRPIIPHEREIEQVPTAEEPAEETLAPKTPPIETGPESTKLEEGQKPEIESQASTPEVVSAQERSVPSISEPVANEQPQERAIQEPSSETPVETAPQPEKVSEEESEPFADILENKDKKRYSSTPLPQQSAEQTS